MSRPRIFFRLLVCLLVLALIALGVVVGSQTRLSEPERQLQGVWTSDREATVADMRARGVFSEEAIERLALVFGRMEIRYDGRHSVSRFSEPDSGEVSEHKSYFKATALEGNRVRLEVYDESDTKFSRVLEAMKHQWLNALKMRFTGNSPQADEPLVYYMDLHDDHYWIWLGEPDGPRSFGERFVRQSGQ